MSDLFAPYGPRDPGDTGGASVPPSLVIRNAVVEDCESLARISHQRNGGDLAEHVAGFGRELRAPPDPTRNLLLAALVDDRVVGYGKADVFVPPDDAPPNCAPRGWYLTGVTIEPPMRRRGIGLALTRARLERVARRSVHAHYFANAMNRASIDLHARLGFEEVTRDFWYPRTSFTGGAGILFRAALARGRS